MRVLPALLAAMISFGTLASSAEAGSHGTITRAVAKNATGHLVVEGAMYCDLRTPEKGIPPMCSGGEPIEWAGLYVNANGERCGKPGGYFGYYPSPSNEITVTSYAFRVTGKVELGKHRPTEVCLLRSEEWSSPNAECAEFFDPSLCAKEYHESSSVMTSAPIEWVGPPPRIPRLGGERARGILETALERRLGRAFTSGYNRARPMLECDYRLGRSRLSCSIRYDNPNALFSGRAQVRLSHCETSVCWYVSFRIEKEGVNCVYRRNKTVRQCTKVLAGRESDFLREKV